VCLGRAAGEFVPRCLPEIVGPPARVRVSPFREVPAQTRVPEFRSGALAPRFRKADGCQRDGAKSPQMATRRIRDLRTPASGTVLAPSDPQRAGSAEPRELDASGDDPFQAKAAARPRLRRTPTRESKRMECSSASGALGGRDALGAAHCLPLGASIRATDTSSELAVVVRRRSRQHAPEAATLDGRGTPGAGSARPGLSDDGTTPG
jgi:hypothetical protein